MKLFVAALAAMGLVLVAAPAAASPRVGDTVPLTLSPHDEVTVMPRDRGGWGVIFVRPTDIEPEIPPAARDATTETMRPTERPIRFTAPEGNVRFTFWSNPREGAWLKIENNVGRPIIYSAEIAVRGQAGFHATSICSVGQGMATYELWPDDITALRITGFYPAPSDRRVCGHPERGEIGAPPPTAPEPGGGK
jgi:hypothetical protein